MRKLSAGDRKGRPYARLPLRGAVALARLRGGFQKLVATSPSLLRNATSPQGEANGTSRATARVAPTQGPLVKGGCRRSRLGDSFLIFTMNPSTAFGGPPPFNKGGSRETASCLNPYIPLPSAIPPAAPRRLPRRGACYGSSKPFCNRIESIPSNVRSLSPYRRRSRAPS